MLPGIATFQLTITKTKTFLRKRINEPRATIRLNLSLPYLLQCNLIIWRSIINAEYHTHSASLFRKLKILDIFSINTLNIAQFMFHINHKNTLPTQFCSMFQTNSDVHAYSTRTANHYITHSAAQTLKSKQFCLKDQNHQWNSFPLVLTSLYSLNSFRKLIYILLEKQTQTVCKTPSSLCN